MAPVLESAAVQRELAPALLPERQGGEVSRRAAPAAAALTEPKVQPGAEAQGAAEWTGRLSAPVENFGVVRGWLLPCPHSATAGELQEPGRLLLYHCVYESHT